MEQGIGRSQSHGWLDSELEGSEFASLSPDFARVYRPAILIYSLELASLLRMIYLENL